MMSSVDWIVFAITIIFSGVTAALVSQLLNIVQQRQKRIAEQPHKYAQSYQALQSTMDAMQDNIEGLRLHIANLEGELGSVKATSKKDKAALETKLNEEQALRRRDKVEFKKAMAVAKSKNDVTIQELKGRITELERDLEDVKNERDHLFIENSKLRSMKTGEVK